MSAYEHFPLAGYRAGQARVFRDQADLEANGAGWRDSPADGAALLIDPNAEPTGDVSSLDSGEEQEEASEDGLPADGAALPRRGRGRPRKTPIA